MAIAVEVLDEAGARVTADAVKKLVAAVIEAEGVDGVAVSVTFVDEPVIAELNLRYRDVNGATDVLSFPEVSGADDWPESLWRELGGREAELLDLGEIVVCPAVVCRYAMEEGNETHRQMAWTIVHGVLHLLGYDHETDAGEMRARELALLRDVAPLTASLMTPEAN
jgi:probable rRNA maturation factor